MPIEVDSSCDDNLRGVEGKRRDIMHTTRKGIALLKERRSRKYDINLKRKFIQQSSNHNNYLYP
jgi:hypothetical protein